MLFTYIHLVLVEMCNKFAHELFFVEKKGDADIWVFEHPPILQRFKKYKKIIFQKFKFQKTVKI